MAREGDRERASGARPTCGGGAPGLRPGDRGHPPGRPPSSQGTKGWGGVTGFAPTPCLLALTAPVQALAARALQRAQPWVAAGVQIGEADPALRDECLPQDLAEHERLRATPTCGRTPGSERFWVKYHFKTDQAIESGTVNDIHKERNMTDTRKADSHGTTSADKMWAPVANHHLFFCGFHIANKNPKFQATTMHHCRHRGQG